MRDYYKNEIPDNICKVIYNGISKEFLMEKKYEQRNSKVIFLISGNLHRNKGQNLALQAVRRLKDEGINNFELWIAGQASAMSDSKKYEMELREYVKNYLGDSCRFLGFVSNMKEVRRKADIELVCSNREAFGRVTVEAMMAGNPVIGTDTGANPELIDEKKTGRLFRNGEAEDLAEKMKWFIKEPAHIEECGRNAYHEVKSKFLSENNTENLKQLYYGMVKENVE